MDNVTHSLVGAALGECVLQSHPDPERAGRARGAYWLVSILANNFPDVDLLWSVGAGGKLQYLLHHRGHSHTLIWALPQGLLVLALVILFLRARGRGTDDRSGRRRLVALALLGPFVHLWMDSWNLYGVHLFWPFQNAWGYGDRVFIVEPWIWAAVIPALMTVPALRARGRWWLLVLFGLVLVAGGSTGLVPGPVLGALALAFGLWWALAAWLGRGAVPAGLALSVLLVLAQGRLSTASKAAVRARLPAPPHDVVTSPFPADPRCWMVYTVESDPALDLYRVRRGVWSATGDDAAGCKARFEGPTTSPLFPVELPDTAEVAWAGEFRGSLAELRRLDREHCLFAAFLRFARTPYWFVGKQGGRVYGDVRFDRGRGLGFADLIDEEGPDADCDELWIPEWEKPTRSVLTGRGR